MAKTKSQLATAVLQRLKVLQAEETPSSDDSNLVQTIYTDKLAELKHRNAAYWAADSIPDQVYRVLVTYMANEVAPEFHQSYSVELEKELRNQLKELMATHSSGEPVQAVYY